MGPVNRIAAEERGCASGKAGDSWGREALGKHLDSLQSIPEAAPAEDNQKLPPSPVHFCIQICTNKDKTFFAY